MGFRSFIHALGFCWYGPWSKPRQYGWGLIQEKTCQLCGKTVAREIDPCDPLY